MKWIIAIALIVSLGIMGYFYVSLNTVTPQQVSVTTATTTMRSISIIHAFKDGEHRFSGQVRLPHSCYALDAEAIHDPHDAKNIIIDLTTKDKMLDQALCAQLPTNYPFQILAEAPEDITVHASLNGEELSVRLTETDWESSNGTYINSVNN